MGEEIQESKRDEMLNAAFIGWQVISVWSEKVPSFNKYAARFGLMNEQPDVSRRDIEQGRRQSQRNKAIALRAFEERGVERA